MMKYKFEEVLNDLMDYFILGDPDHLLQYKIKNSLPEDLLTEFTTHETGDQAVEQGAITPMIGIENYPYTIYFNLSDDTPELLKPESVLQHKRDGYCLRVDNGRIYLFTIPYLQNFTEETVRVLKKLKKATVKVPNGWYSVSILGGLTRQVVDYENANGENKAMITMEPTLEFLIKRSKGKPKYTVDFMHRFEIEIN